jgi:hypothetical protein
MCGEEMITLINMTAKSYNSNAAVVGEVSGVPVSRAVTSQHESQLEFESIGVAKGKDFRRRKGLQYGSGGGLSVRPGYLKD